MDELPPKMSPDDRAAFDASTLTESEYETDFRLSPSIASWMKWKSASSRSDTNAAAIPNCNIRRIDVK
jgi:hypothetical protein